MDHNLNARGGGIYVRLLVVQCSTDSHTIFSMCILLPPCVSTLLSPATKSVALSRSLFFTCRSNLLGRKSGSWKRKGLNYYKLSQIEEKRLRERTGEQRSGVGESYLDGCKQQLYPSQRQLWNCNSGELEKRQLPSWDLYQNPRQPPAANQYWQNTHMLFLSFSLSPLWYGLCSIRN